MIKNYAEDLGNGDTLASFGFYDLSAKGDGDFRAWLCLPIIEITPEGEYIYPNPFCLGHFWAMCEWAERNTESEIKSKFGNMIGQALIVNEFCLSTMPTPEYYCQKARERKSDSCKKVKEAKTAPDKLCPGFMNVSRLKKKVEKNGFACESMLVEYLAYQMEKKDWFPAFLTTQKNGLPKEALEIINIKGEL